MFILTFMGTLQNFTGDHFAHMSNLIGIHKSSQHWKIHNSWKISQHLKHLINFET